MHADVAELVVLFLELILTGGTGSS